MCFRSNLHVHWRWPCRRSRWWILLLPSVWSRIGLYPTEQFVNVGSIFAQWGDWPVSEEEDLRLCNYEVEKYLNPCYGEDKRLEMTDVTATLLHSYGNALQSRPCLCRVAPFSEAPLQTHGLRGYFGISSQRSCTPSGLSSHSGVSTCTSCFPVTSWTFCLATADDFDLQPPEEKNAHITQQLDRIPSPEHQLDQHCMELLRHSQGIFQILHGDGPDPLLASPLAWDGLSDLPPPHEQYVILILKHQQTYHTHILFLRGDKFLFEALSTIGARPVKFLIDEKGKVYGRDYRVWRSLRWVTLDPTLWPPQLTEGYNMPTPGPQQPTNLYKSGMLCGVLCAPWTF